MSSHHNLPLIAIVGRPNVGKSTLFNRLTGKRRALVSREPGMTRDRRFETGEWCGCAFEVVDTGGLLDTENPLSQHISKQALLAIEDASLVLFLVDGREGMSTRDQEIAGLLRRSGHPVFLLVNKIDTQQHLAASAEFHEFGFEQVFAVSAEHGLGVDEVLDHMIDLLKLKPSQQEEKRKGIRVVILGKPNAGKSTFINSLLGAERLITSEIPGTTRDTIDIEVQTGEDLFVFVDTAGIRKKGQTKTVPDKLAVIHARKSLEKADVACIMIDGAVGITHQDAVVTGYAWTAGKAIVLIFNKMDMLSYEAKRSLEMEADSTLKFIRFAPRLYVSAKTGQNVDQLFPILKKVYSSHSKRVTTGQLNAFFDRALANRYLGKAKGGKPIKLKYITQVGIQPPSFVLFTNAASKLHFSHRRYLENELRSHFGFEGATLRIKVKRSKG